MTGEYWVVNQILAKNLHNTDADILNYTTTLMDRLEQVRHDGLDLTVLKHLGTIG